MTRQKGFPAQISWQNSFIIHLIILILKKVPLPTVKYDGEMQVLTNLLEILSKPFPEPEGNFAIHKIAALFGGFVVGFLYIFQPFGIDIIVEHKFLICMGFGVMTYLGIILVEGIKEGLRAGNPTPATWTFGKWIVYNLAAMLIISLANFLFARLVMFGYIEWALFPHMLYGTFMVGIIPVVVLGGYAVISQEKKYQHIAEGLTHPQISLPSAGMPPEEHTLFDIPISQIKYIQGLQNYVSIGYVDAQNQFNKKTERATLKHILEQVPADTIIRAHRSFLVNPRAIISAAGNAQGLVLHLTDCDHTVPVSRTYVPSFREKWAQLAV